MRPLECTNQGRIAESEIGVSRQDHRVVDPLAGERARAVPTSDVERVIGAGDASEVGRFDRGKVQRADAGPRQRRILEREVSVLNAGDRVDARMTAGKRSRAGPTADIKGMPTCAGVGEDSLGNTGKRQQPVAVGVSQGCVGEDEIGILRGDDCVGPPAARDHPRATPAADVERIIAGAAGEVGRFDRVERESADSRTRKRRIGECEVRVPRPDNRIIPGETPAERSTPRPLTDVEGVPYWISVRQIGDRDSNQLQRPVAVVKAKEIVAENEAGILRRNDRVDSTAAAQRP